MEQFFDNRIKQLRDIQDYEIYGHYATLFTNAIAEILIKLGFEENREYFFNNKKRRKSYLDNRDANDIISISFFYDCVHQQEIYLGVTYETGDSYLPVNYFSTIHAQPSLSWFCSVYNYLRTEWNSSKNKARKNK